LEVTSKIELVPLKKKVFGPNVDNNVGHGNGVDPVNQAHYAADLLLAQAAQTPAQHTLQRVTHDEPHHAFLLDGHQHCEHLLVVAERGELLGRIQEEHLQ